MGSGAYLDANILIYLVEGLDGHPEYMGRSKKIIAKAAADNTPLFTSSITVGECLHGAFKQNSPGLVEDYERLFATGKLRLVPVSADIIRRAAQLAAERGAKLVDAIHMASAESAKCHVFYTNDQGLIKAMARGGSMPALDGSGEVI
jgi:predicted nucleic acid-binding protein